MRSSDACDDVVVECDDPFKTVVTLSVVSHRQATLVEQLLHDVSTYCSSPIEVIVTVNVPEPNAVDPSRFDFPVRVVENRSPKGFGANHNASFQRGAGEYFCVINPDIRLSCDPFPALVAALSDATVGVAGPLVFSPTGSIEDSARAFPTLGRLATKAWRTLVRRAQSVADYPIAGAPVYPDWIGGMCMLFRSSTFRSLDGFDERYYLYYEDVDLCWRLRRAGHRVVLDPRSVVEHRAQRRSWRSARYLRWHLSSMARFLVTQARG